MGVLYFYILTSQRCYYGTVYQQYKVYRNSLAWLPEDSRRPPKKVGVDRYHVFLFVHASRFSYKINYISLYARSKINKLLRMCLLPYLSLKAKMCGL